MFLGIFDVLYNLIGELTVETVYLFNRVVELSSHGANLDDYIINLVLFSDTPIISTDLEQLLILFFTIFYSMFFILLLYKVTKKIIKSVFGVIKI